MPRTPSPLARALHRSSRGNQTATTWPSHGNRVVITYATTAHVLLDVTDTRLDPGHSVTHRLIGHVPSILLGLLGEFSAESADEFAERDRRGSALAEPLCRASRELERALGVALDERIPLCEVHGTRPL